MSLDPPSPSLLSVSADFALPLPFATIDPASQHQTLLEHMQKIGNISGLQRALLVMGVEANLGFEATHIVHAMRKAGIRHVALHEAVQDGPGLLTTNESKEMMCIALQELLDLRRLSICTQLLSISNNPREALEQLSKQLATYTIYVEPPKNPFGKVKRTYTGKMAGNQDDLCIAMQLAILSSRIFLRKDKYQRFHKH